jgi:UDP-3-O-[3-hydroxymyristoyl] glucosamine N-acyltransferase
VPGRAGVPARRGGDMDGLADTPMNAETRKSFSLAELAACLGGTVAGDGNTRINQIAPLESAGPGEISFLVGKKYQKVLQHTGAAAVIVSEDGKDLTLLPRIVCANPYAYYARVAALLNPEEPAEPGIDPRASVHPGASIPGNASIGPCAVVEDGAVIGERAVVGPNCFVGRRTRIGASSRLHAGAVIYHDCVIGERVVIHSGAVIGADGFGIAMDEGRWVKIPQIGRVVIGDDVEIGASTTIDRGAMDDTVIEDGVRMDNQIQIGHNCTIGAHTAIAGCVGIAGSTKIGRYCRLGGSAMISGHLTIADRVDISGGTLVAKSISSPGSYTSVFPMSPHAEWLKNASLIRHLHDMMERVRVLEKRLGSNGRK